MEPVLAAYAHASPAHKAILPHLTRSETAILGSCGTSLSVLLRQPKRQSRPRLLARGRREANGQSFSWGVSFIMKLLVRGDTVGGLRLKR
jgi:hypothetical protein